MFKENDRKSKAIFNTLTSLAKAHLEFKSNKKIIVDNLGEKRYNLTDNAIYDLAMDLLELNKKLIKE